MPVLQDGPDPWSGPSEDNFFLYVGICICLVCMGGIMSGLQQGLMQLDRITIEGMKVDASSLKIVLLDMILPLIRRRHLLLVTLLVWNALAMEALPIFMDVLVPKFAAIVLSVSAVVLFGEIIPQAVCLKWPGDFACAFIPLVWVLMVLILPISYPIACFLDYSLGASHSKRWTRSGLRDLVMEQETGVISNDELDVITGALELYNKNVHDVLIPIKDVFSLPFDSPLTDSMLRELQYCGHSRIPIWKNERTNILGVLLVKHLIRIDPAKHLCVKDLQLVPVLKVTERVPLFNLLRQFRTGTSHMAVVVGDEPSENQDTDFRSRGHSIGLSTTNQRGIHVVGIITLEDLLEEILKSEIQDETDSWKPVNDQLDSRLKEARNLRKGILKSISVADEDDEETSLVTKEDRGYGSLNDFSVRRASAIDSGLEP